jgi:hypothetical protein
MLCCELASFASLDDVIDIFYRHWLIETLPEGLFG